MCELHDGRDSVIDVRVGLHVRICTASLFGNQSFTPKNASPHIHIRVNRDRTPNFPTPKAITSGRNLADLGRSCSPPFPGRALGVPDCCGNAHSRRTVRLRTSVHPGRVRCGTQALYQSVLGSSRVYLRARVLCQVIWKPQDKCALMWYSRLGAQRSSKSLPRSEMEVLSHLLRNASGRWR